MRTRDVAVDGVEIEDAVGSAGGGVRAEGAADRESTGPALADGAADRRGIDPVLASALGGAYGAFGVTFRGPRERFWQRMTATGAALGVFALLARPELRRTRIRARDVALGLASATGLYGVFQVGDRAARRIMPTGAQDIDEIYALRSLRPRGEIAARLALVVGPAEELFWRGLVLRRMQARHGRWRGAALAALAYGGAHVVTGNATLTGAATTAGAYWSALAAAGMPMGSLIVSHVAWDVWIFLVQPTQAVPEA